MRYLQRSSVILACFLIMCAKTSEPKAVVAQPTPLHPAQPSTSHDRPRWTTNMAGWTIHVNSRLWTEQPEATGKAMVLLQKQLEEINRNVPKAAVIELQKVTLWISPEYPGIKPRAEYHPNAVWLREHGRDPAMAKGVEFTNVRIFESEARRMPNFALHELAHSYHDRVLPKGFGNPDIKAAYERAKAGGKYDRVEQRFGDGRTTQARAYAMTNPQEYFAENTEAFFSTNDFFPFTRTELKPHDPEMFELLAKLWGVELK
ncbi:MAG: zinc-dependent peptidase [Verrucomicrobiota bacterium]